MAKIIELANKKHYSIRCCNDVEYGEFLFDQIKALLDLFGTKKDKPGRHPDLLLFHYNESGHDHTTYEVSDEFAEIIWEFFLHQRKERLKEYSHRQMEDGTKLLFRLNDGSLSVDDFDETLKKK